MYNKSVFFNFALLLSFSAFSAAMSVGDTPFQQEYHEAYPFKEVDPGTIFRVGPGPSILSSSGLWQWNESSKVWENSELEGVCTDYSLDNRHKISYLAKLDGLIEHKRNPQSLFQESIIATAGTISKDGMPQYLVGAGTVHTWDETSNSYSLTFSNLPRSVRDAVADPSDGSLWVATGMGLCHVQDNTLQLFQRPDEILSSDVRALAFDAQKRLWAACFGGVAVFESGKMIQQFTPVDGLPMLDATAVVQGANGDMWVGMARGIARYDGKKWSARFSKRWLLDDQVIDLYFHDGSLFVATPKGLSAIKSDRMTLEDKARYFHDVAIDRHYRAPGFVEKCILPEPGNTAKWEPEDDDNDGEYTAEFLVMESFRYAATKSRNARMRAHDAFQALKFLQTVTNTEGFFARTVVPPDWTHPNDPNLTYTEEEKQLLALEDPRFKPVEVRWHLSEDGKWLWKGDTSSDEMCGHFYGYALYYDLVCNEEEKREVATHTAKIMDYLIAGGYNFIDVDATHTRWGVWSPDMLNNDPDWAAERGINSAELLSYLLTTWHMTGEEKYRKEYERLLYEENFLENVKEAKTFAPAWETHIDDTLLIKVFPALLLYEKDPELLKVYHQAFEDWYAGIRNEFNPYFNFTYNWLGKNAEQLDDSLFFLRDCPLDLVSWHIDQSWREDIQIVREPIWEERSMSRLVPPSERAVVRWDKNPWMIAGGDGGRTEWAPTFWLLPYWMGRYLGLIAAP